MCVFLLSLFETMTSFGVKSLLCTRCTLNNCSKPCCTVYFAGDVGRCSPRSFGNADRHVRYSAICARLPCSDLLLRRGTRSSFPLYLGTAHNTVSNKVPAFSSRYSMTLIINKSLTFHGMSINLSQIKQPSMEFS